VSRFYYEGSIRDTLDRTKRVLESCVRAAVDGRLPLTKPDYDPRGREYANLCMCISIYIEKMISIERAIGGHRAGAV